MKLTVNGRTVAVDAEGDTPLLWVLRDNLGLYGTKYGCGKGLCGACSVEVDGELRRSCVLPVDSVAGKSVATIEGLSKDGLSPVQTAWLKEQVPQCGYCQSGMLMAASNLLRKTPAPTDEEIDNSITNICRCGTYPRVRKAIHRAAKLSAQSPDS